MIFFNDYNILEYTNNNIIDPHQNSNNAALSYHSPCK